MCGSIRSVPVSMNRNGSQRRPTLGLILPCASSRGQRVDLHGEAGKAGQDAWGGEVL